MPLPRTGPDRARQSRPTAAPAIIADPAGAIEEGERSHNAYGYAYTQDDETLV